MASDPADELVDLLDHAGRVIGIVTRRRMRGERLPHRCVYVLVFNTRGELFVHQRTAKKDVFPSYWDLTVGGVLAAGETFDDGAVREGCEELGVDLRPTFLFPFHYDGEHSIAFANVYQAVHEGPFQLQPEEIVGGEFVPVSNLAGWIQRKRFCPDGLEVWSEFSRRQKW